MDMESKDQVCPRNLLHVFDDGGVALVGRNQLFHPVRKRMSAGRCDLQAVACRQRGQLTAQFDYLLARTRCIVTNFRAQLDHRLVHLRLDPLFQNVFAAGNDFLNVRSQLTCLRINDLEFLLDTKSEDVIFHRSR